MTAGGRLAPWAALGLPLAVLDGGSGLGLLTMLAFDGVLIAAAVFEARALARRAPTAERHLEPRLVVGADNAVTVRLHNRTARPLRVVVRDDVPAGWRADPDERTLELPPWSRREVTYTVRPLRRGLERFGDLHLRVEGRARLGAALVRVAAVQEARVYPDLLSRRSHALRTRFGDLRRIGTQSVRMQGGGGELAHLREYVPGDPYRDLDWKSTAKRHRPITRSYQQERSQHVLLCIDAGRMMATRVDAVSKLDHAIEAALRLAQVALRNGDRVGLVVFSDDVRTFVPPRAGFVQYRRILDAVYAVEAAETAVDFRRLVEFLQVRVPRRALLILFSDLLDETHAAPLAEHVGILRRRHLPMCVTMDDPVARDLADAPVHDVEGAYRRAAAADVLTERERMTSRLAKRGVQLVEAASGELALATVDRYLDLKARNRL